MGNVFLCGNSLNFRYRLFSHLFRQRYLPVLYRNQQSNETSGGGSVVSASQETLLKLLDAYLHSCDSSALAEFCSSEELERQLCTDFLISEFQSLARWSIQAMNDAMSQEANVDSRLVNVHIALILVLQSLMSVAVASDTTTDKQNKHIDAFVSSLREPAFLDDLLGKSDTEDNELHLSLTSVP